MYPGFGPSLLGLGVLLLFSGCQQLSDFLGITDPWAGYYDTTENYIGASGLSSSTIDLTTAGYQSPAKWTWAWRGDSDADDAAGGYQYMDLSLSGDSPPSSLAVTTPVYELGLVNLYPGDAGDFEGSANLPANWVIGNGAYTSSLAQTSGLQIHGTESIQINTSSSDYADFDLSSIKDQSGAAASHIYSWRFYLRTGSTYGNEIASSFNPSLIQTLTTVTSTSDQKIDNLAVAPASGDRLFFGASNSLSFIMDDIRIFRQDIKEHLSLRLLLRPEDAAHTLRSGYYEFTLWVKKPASTYFLSTDTTAKMPYAASSVTLRMLSLSLDAGNQALHVFPIDGSADAETGSIYDAASGWVLLSLRMKADRNFSIDSSSSDPVIELAIFPFDTANPDPGVVEIADPELHYFRDGY